MDRAPVELKVTDVHKLLSGKRVLAGIDLAGRPGDTIVISGPNGAGKSTLLRVVCGLLDPSRGDVEIGGCSIRRQAREAKALLGYVPDGLEALPDLLASEFVAMVRTLRPSLNGGPVAIDMEWMQRLEVAPFWDQRLGTLSFGQRKRVALLAALCGRPPLLVLDEPTNSLDPQGIDLVKTLIAERERAKQITLLSTNDATFERTLAGVHYRLHEGKLIDVAGAANAERP